MVIKNIEFTIGLFLLFFLSAPVVVKSQQLFRKYNVENGLPQNYVYSISQTANGALLIATGEGLVRYNGVEFNTIHTDSALSSSFVTGSIKTREGDIYMTHFNGEISKYENEHLSIISPAIEYANITAFHEDSHGRLWFLRQQASISYIDPTDDQLHHLERPFSSYSLNDLTTINENHFLFATDNGAFLSELKEGKWIQKDALESLNNTIVSKILPIDSFTFWLTTNDQGIYQCTLNKDRSAFNKVQKLPIDPTLTNGQVSILMDQWGDVWIGSKKAGLNRIALNDGQIKVTAYGKKDGIDTKLIKQLFQDKEGTLWIGTYGGGLYQLMDRVLQQHSIKGMSPSNDVRSLVEADPGTLLLGTTKGLLKVRTDRKKLTKINEYQALNGFIITSLAMSKEGKTWVGTEQSGVFVMNKNGNVSRDRRLNDLEQKKVNHLLVDMADNVWISTETEGVIMLKKDGERITYNTANKLHHNQVLMTYEDENHRLWFATFGGGLAMYKEGEILIQNQQAGLYAHDFNSITSDQQGIIWIATYGTGVYKNNNFQFDAYLQNEKLLSNYNYLITTDERNNIWVGSRIGLSKIDPSNEQVSNYKIAGKEVNRNAVLKTSQNDLWFGTNNGLIRHNYNTYHRNLTPPVTRVEKLIVNHDSVSLHETEYKWLFGQYSLQFTLEGLSLKNPENVRYRYQLSGFDKEWSDPQTSRYLKFSNLAENDYTLSFQSCNNDGIWGEVSTFSFTIYPPFWRTWWFIIACNVFIIASIILTIRWREKSLKESNRKLELTIAQRTALVVEQRNQIAEKNKDIQDSINYASRIQQAILSDVEFQHNFVEDMFILYLPKDVVSGDFYWIKEENDRLIVAAVDCTGHGVPGAFLSIIGENGLRSVTQEQDLTNPAQVLDALNVYVLNTLNQKNEDDQILDGMDMSICMIDKNGFQFAGAKNPLYSIINGEVSVTKADRYAIGNHETNSSPFTNHRFKRNKDEVLYMFSDGFADQFGGPNGKKYMYRQFRELLASISHLPLSEQKEKLENEFMNWKDHREQIDDILVIGMKL